MSSLLASRLVVGPRRAGRDYDVLAASPGLQPAVEDLGRIRRHNFEVRNFVRPGRPVTAFFPLHATGADVWLLAVTSLNGEAAGNPVWITTGVVLTPQILDVLDGRVLPLAQAWPDAEPPAPGSQLAPLAISAPPPPPAADPQVAAWAERLGRARLAIEAPAETIDPLLAAVLDAAPAWRRRNLGFLTAPPEAAGGEAPALVVFEPGAAGELAGYERIALREAAATPTRAAPASGWDALLETAAHDRFELSRSLDQAARASTAPPARVTTEAQIRRWVDAYLDTLPGDLERMDALFHLVRSARRVPDDAARAESVRALFKSFEARMKAATDPSFWLVQYLDKIEAAIGDDGPPLLPARLAIETGILFALDAPHVARLAPAVAESLAEPAREVLRQGPAVTVEALDALFAAAAAAIAAHPREAPAARLAIGLIEALSMFSRTRSRETAQVVLELLIANGRTGALSELRGSAMLGRIKQAPIGERLGPALARALNAAPRTKLQHPERMAAALSLWRLGAAWGAA